MARIRTIKPEFWTDEKILKVSPMARLLLIGLLNFADDKGNIEAGSLSIKSKIFPGDDVDMRPFLTELTNKSLLDPYSVEGENYYHIKGFLKHQKIDNPSKPRCPLYEPSYSTQVTITKDSTQEGKGMERKGKEGEKRIDHLKTDDPFLDMKKDYFVLSWEAYPCKKSKEKAWRRYNKQVLTVQDHRDLLKSIENYIKETVRCRENGHPTLAWQHGSTFYNENWRDYIDYQPPDDPTTDPWEKVKRER